MITKKIYDQTLANRHCIVLGPVDAGKTSLVHAISHVIQTRQCGKIITPLKGNEKNEFILQYAVEYTPLVLFDFPKHYDICKFMITDPTPLDAAILVVSATDGYHAQIREQIILCQNLGVKSIIVFINQTDAYIDEEKLNLLAMEIEDTLAENEYFENPVVYGSASKALENPNSEWGDKIMELIEEVDNFVPLTFSADEEPFFMPIEEVFGFGGSIIATGKVSTGKVHVNDEIEVVGIRPHKMKSIVTGIQLFRKPLEQAGPGDNVGLKLSGIPRTELERGQVIASPGSIYAHNHFQAIIHVFTREDGGSTTPILNNVRQNFYFYTGDMTGFLKFDNGLDMCMPGDMCWIDVTLICPIAMTIGTTFYIRDKGRKLAAGKIIDIIE